MFYIGIDLGTTSVKLLLVDDHGKVEKTISKDYPISFPNPGWSQQNPQDWWEQTVKGLKELTAGIDPAMIKGIGCGGLLLGVIETFAKAYISTQLSDAIVFAVLIIVLLIRPTGLLGKKVSVKV